MIPRNALHQSFAWPRVSWCILILVVGFGPAVNAEHPVQPNVVILLADDMGYRDAGCYGGPVRTPNIDGLAAAGVRFTDFHSGAAVCSPSRATLLTGRHHIRAGVYSWIFNDTQRSHLLERETTLAEVLRAAGYATAHIGKWHLGLPTPDRAKPTPADHGFDYWFATDNNAHPSHRNPDNFLRNGTPVGELQGYSAHLIADEAIQWLKGPDAGSRPFFLNVWFHEPHAPIAAPAEMVQGYGDLEDKGAIYSGTIENMDGAIGRLLSTLQEMGVAENTVILFASDNGSYRRDRVGELQGSKGTNWEGGIRVPGILRWPGQIPAGRVESTPAGLIDMLPTLCRLVGVAPPAGVHVDEADLSPLWSERTFQRDQPLFWHLQKARPIVAVRSGRWSLVADPAFELSRDNLFDESWIPRIRAGSYQNFRLFDLEIDVGQTTDVADKHPAVVRELSAQLLNINASIMRDGPDWSLPE